VKNVSKMTYFVSGGTLNLISISQSSLYKHYINHNETLFTFDVLISNRELCQKKLFSSILLLILATVSFGDRNVKGKYSFVVINIMFA